MKYDTTAILELCNRFSTKLTRENRNMIAGEWPASIGQFTHKKHFHITQHKIALLAMLTIQNYRYAHGKKPNPREFIALVNNVSTIRNEVDDLSVEDPKEKLFGILVRLAYMQFPFQEGIHNLLPRHLLIYLNSKVESPPIDLDSVFHKNFGLHIIDYMTIGLAYYISSLHHMHFPRSFIENTKIRSLRKYVAPENVDNFISRATTDFRAFRDLCMREVTDYPKGGTYRFNPLFDRPIIIRKDRRFCIPVPMLVPYVVTKGLYYDFLDLFSGVGDNNPFCEWFGHAFEQYVGLLLKDTFGEKNVFSEPVYGKEHKRGPDWTVINGNSAIVFECRSGRLNKKAKVYGEYEDISGLIDRNIIAPLVKIPNKIKDVKDGLTSIPCSKDMESFPCIVTYEPLYSTELFIDMIKQEFKDREIPLYHFELMSIEDLEWLLAWANFENPIEFLKTKKANPDWKAMNVRQLIGEKAKELKIDFTNVRNTLLDREFDRFWHEVTPELEKQTSD